MIEGPFLITGMTSTNATNLPAKPGIRYFIHSIAMTFSMAAASAGGACHVAGYVNNSNPYFLHITPITGAIQYGAVNAVFDILTDENKAVTFTKSATVDNCFCMITYKEVMAG
jgi:hypothetical protein